MPVRLTTSIPKEAGSASLQTTRHNLESIEVFGIKAFALLGADQRSRASDAVGDALERILQMWSIK